MDIVVASPGRLLQHKERGNLFLSQVNYIVIDEVDTMLTQGFGSDIRAILRSTMLRKDSKCLSYHTVFYSSLIRLYHSASDCNSF